MIDASIKVYTGKEMTAQDFALLIETMFPGKSGILYGCVLSVSETIPNAIHITDGWVVVRGRIVYINEGDIQVPLPSNPTTKYIILRISLSSLDEPAVVEVSDFVQSDTKEFNVAAGDARLALGSISASITGLSPATLKSIKALPSTPTIRSGKTPPDDSIGNDGDIYIQYS